MRLPKPMQFDSLGYDTEANACIIHDALDHVYRNKGGVGIAACIVIANDTVYELVDPQETTFYGRWETERPATVAPGAVVGMIHRKRDGAATGTQGYLEYTLRRNNRDVQKVFLAWKAPWGASSPQTVGCGFRAMDATLPDAEREKVSLHTRGSESVTFQGDGAAITLRVAITSDTDSPQIVFSLAQQHNIRIYNRTQDSGLKIRLDDDITTPIKLQPSRSIDLAIPRSQIDASTFSVELPFKMKSLWKWPAVRGATFIVANEVDSKLPGEQIWVLQKEVDGQLVEMGRCYRSALEERVADPSDSEVDGGDSTTLQRRCEHALTLTELVLATMNGLSGASASSGGLRTVSLQGKTSRCYLDGRLPKMRDVGLSGDGRKPETTVYFQWIMGPVASRDDAYFLRSISSGQFLSCNGKSVDLVSGDSCPEDDPHLQWILHSTTDGYVLQNAVSGMVLDDRLSSLPWAGVTKHTIDGGPRWIILDLPDDASRDPVRMQLVWQNVWRMFNTVLDLPPSSSVRKRPVSAMSRRNNDELKKYLDPSLLLHASTGSAALIDAMREKLREDKVIQRMVAKHLPWLLADQSPHRASPQLKSIIERTSLRIVSLGPRIRDGSISVEELDQELDNAFQKVGLAYEQDIKSWHDVTKLWKLFENVLFPTLLPLVGIEGMAETTADARETLKKAHEDAFLGPLVSASSIYRRLSEGSLRLHNGGGVVAKAVAVRLLVMRQRVHANTVVIEDMKATIENAIRVLEVFCDGEDFADRASDHGGDGSFGDAMSETNNSETNSDMSLVTSDPEPVEETPVRNNAPANEQEHRQGREASLVISNTTNAPAALTAARSRSKLINPVATSNHDSGSTNLPVYPPFSGNMSSLPVLLPPRASSRDLEREVVQPSTRHHAPRGLPSVWELSNRPSQTQPVASQDAPTSLHATTAIPSELLNSIVRTSQPALPVPQMQARLNLDYWPTDGMVASSWTEAVAQAGLPNRGAEPTSSSTAQLHRGGRPPFSESLDEHSNMRRMRPYIKHRVKVVHLVEHGNKDPSELATKSKEAVRSEFRRAKQTREEKRRANDDRVERRRRQREMQRQSEHHSSSNPGRVRTPVSAAAVHFDALSKDVFKGIACYLPTQDLLSLSHVNSTLLSQLLEPRSEIWTQRLVAREVVNASNAKLCYITRRPIHFPGLKKGAREVVERGGAVVLPPLVREVCGKSSFSISLWFVIETPPPDVYAGGILLGVQSIPWSSPGWASNHKQFIHIDTVGNLYCTIIRKEGVIASGLENERWYHLVLTYDDEKEDQRVYLDGELVHTIRGPRHNEWGCLTNWQIGSGCMSDSRHGMPRPEHCGWYAFRGLIDDFTVRGRVLSPLEIKQLACGRPIGASAEHDDVTWSLRGAIVDGSAELLGRAMKIGFCAPILSTTDESSWSPTTPTTKKQPAGSRRQPANATFDSDVECLGIE